MSNYNGMFENLTKITKARTCRISSWDKTGGNQDNWMVPANETLVLGELIGPGCINHIWMTTSCRRIAAPSLIDPIGNGHSAPVNEIHPALGVVWDAYDPDYYRKVLIKITWEHQENPSVLVPLGDFFGIGNSMPGNYTSLPFNVSVKPEEAFKFGGPASVTCYMPMPINEKATKTMCHSSCTFISITSYIKKNSTRIRCISMLAGKEKCLAMGGEQICK